MLLHLPGFYFLLTHYEGAVMAQYLNTVLKSTTMLVRDGLPFYFAFRKGFWNLPKWGAEFLALKSVRDTVDVGQFITASIDGKAPPEVKFNYPANWSFFEYDKDNPHSYRNYLSSAIKIAFSSYVATILELIVAATLVGWTAAGWGVLCAFLVFTAETYYHAKKLDPNARKSLWESSNYFNKWVSLYGAVLEEISRVVSAVILLFCNFFLKEESKKAVKDNLESFFQNLLAYLPELYWDVFKYLFAFHASFGIVNALGHLSTMAWESPVKSLAKILFPVFDHGLVAKDLKVLELVGNLFVLITLGSLCWNGIHEVNAKAEKGRTWSPIESRQNTELAQNAWAATIVDNFNLNPEKGGVGYGFVKKLCGEHAAKALSRA